MRVPVDRVFTTVSRNLGLDSFSRYVDNWVEWAFEAEQYIGSNDTFVEKEVTYDASGAKATATITFAANPTSGDWIEINGTRLYFRNATDLGEGRSPNEINIGSGLALTLTNSSAPYGLLEELKGFSDTTNLTGAINNSAVFNYPEALNVADYSLSFDVGSEILTNGDFTGGSTGWSLGTGISYSSNAIVFSSATQFQKLNQAITGSDFVAGDSYEVSFTVSNYTGGSIGGNLYNDAGEGISIPSVSANGTYTTKHVIGENSTTTVGLWNRFWLQTTSAAAFSGTIDNVSLKKINSGTLNITAKEIGYEGNEITVEASNTETSGGYATGGKGIFKNQQIRLPDDMIKLLSVRMGDGDIGFVTSSKFRSKLPDSRTYYKNGNRLNFATDNYTDVTISYLGVPKDMRGWPTIRQGHETAVAQYIMWQQKLVEYYNGKLPQYIIKDLESRWYQLCGKVRGDDNMPNSTELLRIGKIWNRLVPLTSWRPPAYDGLNSY